MDTIYDTLAKLDKVANAPEPVKEDSQALMKKGLEDLMKKTKFNKQADYKPFGKGDKDYETGLPKDAKKDKMFDDMKAADAAKMNKQSTYKPFGKDDPDYETGLPKKGKDKKMFEKESDVERDDHAEKAGREVERDAKYDHMKHAKKDGKSVTKDIEYDEKHDKDGMHEAQGYDDKEDESLGMRTGKESSKKQSMKDRRDDSYGKFGKRDKEHADGKMHEEDLKMVKGPDGKMVPHFAADGKGKNDLKKENEEVAENAGTLKDAARQGVLARLAELAGVPAQEIEEALGTPQDIANKIMAENPLDEDEVEEGNEFSGARDEAIKAGKDSFEVDGKTYPVKGDKNESIEEDEEKIDEGYHKNMMQDVEEGMSKKEFAEKYPASKDQYDEIKKEIEKMNEEKVEETTSGSVATSEASDKPAFPNASIYEKYEGNEIVQNAFKLNEDMSINVSAGTDAEPSVNVNASGEDAMKLASLLKLAGMGMADTGSVSIDVAEDQEFANSADNTEIQNTEYMTQDIAGGLNGPKKMAYPRASQGDNAMAVLGEAEAKEVSAETLMQKYQEYKAQ